MIEKDGLAYSGAARARWKPSLLFCHRLLNVVPLVERAEGAVAVAVGEVQRSVSRDGFVERLHALGPFAVPRVQEPDVVVPTSVAGSGGRFVRGPVLAGVVMPATAI